MLARLGHVIWIASRLLNIIVFFACAAAIFHNPKDSDNWIMFTVAWIVVTSISSAIGWASRYILAGY